MNDPNELIPVTDPAEIASIRDVRFRDDAGRMNIMGASIRGEWFGYRHSVEKWRAKRPVSSVGTGQEAQP
jgi:hypothetical protein